MRYVVYLRVSTDQQADVGQGLAIQEAECRSWLRSHRHKLVEVCTDAGRSGGLTANERPGLERALALVGADRADGVLVHRLDRLARDVILQEQLLAEFHRVGKGLRSCSRAEDENLAHTPDDPTRALVRRIVGSVAQYEREVIRMRLHAGRARKLLLGGYAGGGVPYGWASVRGELVQVPAEQRAIRKMRRLVGEGWSYRRVCDELERCEMPSRSPHGRWGPSVVRRIVLRENARKGRGNAIPSPTLEKESA